MNLYDFIFIYDLNGCSDCKKVAESFILSNCHDFKVLLIQVSGEEQLGLNEKWYVILDSSRIFWRYPFKTHRNQLIDLRRKKVELIDYVENRELLCV